MERKKKWPAQKLRIGCSKTLQRMLMTTGQQRERACHLNSELGTPELSRIHSIRESELATTQIVKWRARKLVLDRPSKRTFAFIFILFFCPADYGRHVDPERQQRMQKHISTSYAIETLKNK
jgi:hypothetical protein